MRVTFFDLQDKQNPIHGQAFTDSETLLRAIDSLRDRPPFMAELIGENEFGLTIGIGRLAGCAQHALTEGDPPYLIAKGAAYHDDEIEFLVGDTPTPVLNRYYLLPSELDAIIAHFVETGGRLPAVKWEEI